jgi:hypothetical protein
MTDGRAFVADRVGGLATAAVVFALAVGAIQVRMEDPWSDGALLLVAGGTFLIIYVLGLAGPGTLDRPAPPTSLLIITALLVAPSALLQLARVLGADNAFDSGTLTWMAAVFAVVAAVPSRTRGSAAATLLCAAGLTGVVLAGADWVFDLESLNTFKYLLAGLTAVFFVAGLTTGGARARHGVVLIGAAGLTAVALGVILTGLFGLDVILSSNGGEPWGWVLVQLLSGAALVAYAVSANQPGPAYLGAIVLLQFLVGAALDFSKNGSLSGWPVALLIIGGVVLAYTLRPRRRNT